MKLNRSAAQIITMVAAVVFAFATPLCAQSNTDTDADPLARGGVGLRVGLWDVEPPSLPATTFKNLPQLEVFFERGLDEHIALESSVGAWRRTATRTELTGNQVETHTYVFPLFTALKIYPATTLDHTIEPFFSGGIGFALGLDDVGTNAIGGGGTTIVTGFGFHGGVGLDLHITRALGMQAAARYQWIQYGEALGGGEQFKGFGVEGGITYRLQF
jgi:hypothetical protein